MPELMTETKYQKAWAYLDGLSRGWERCYGYACIKRHQRGEEMWHLYTLVTPRRRNAIVKKLTSLIK